MYLGIYMHIYVCITKSNEKEAMNLSKEGYMEGLEGEKRKEEMM